MNVKSLRDPPSLPSYSSPFPLYGTPLSSLPPHLGPMGGIYSLGLSFSHKHTHTYTHQQTHTHKIYMIQTHEKDHTHTRKYTHIQITPKQTHTQIHTDTNKHIKNTFPLFLVVALTILALSFFSLPFSIIIIFPKHGRLK